MLPRNDRHPDPIELTLGIWMMFIFFYKSKAHLCMSDETYEGLWNCEFLDSIIHNWL